MSNSPKRVPGFAEVLPGGPEKCSQNGRLPANALSLSRESRSGVLVSLTFMSGSISPIAKMTMQAHGMWVHDPHITYKSDR